MINVNLDKYKNILNNSDYIEYAGRVKKVVGLTIESSGPRVNVGEVCLISTGKNNIPIYAEVVGFKDKSVLLMPYGDMEGIGPGSTVIAQGDNFKVAVGDELLGRIFDGTGKVIDGNDKIKTREYYPVMNSSPHPLRRKRITEILPLGVKAIDGLLTVGKGQRVGIFAGSGVGKSTLIGMICRNTKADVNVIALIGERGREVREFIERDLKEEGLKRSVVIVATSDQPALVRQKAAFVATAVAEYFRDKGNDVLFLMDSLTRFAMAQREIGLAVGEPPVSRGYTPSVFALIPKLLERSGCSKDRSITGLYTVLVDGDDFTEPVTDTARGTLDGHIVLSRELANRNHYPSIDILSSISRLMNEIVSPEHKSTANEIKKVMAVYKEAEDLINIGAYVRGSNEKIDYAMDVIDRITDFLMQGAYENYSFKEVMDQMQKVL